MKDVRESAKVIGGMLRGQAEYDSAAATEALTVFKKASGHFGDLFPEGSETGEETEAAPAIWEDRAGFDAKWTAYAEATAAMQAVAGDGLDALRPAIGAVGQTCGGCHGEYCGE